MGRRKEFGGLGPVNCDSILRLYDDNIIVMAVLIIPVDQATDTPDISRFGTKLAVRRPYIVYCLSVDDTMNCR